MKICKITNKVFLKLPFKKKPNYDDYRFCLKDPIDYRYLSFNHFTTWKMIVKIQKPYWIIQNALSSKLLIIKKVYWKFLNFCECKQIKKYDKEYYEKWVLE